MDYSSNFMATLGVEVTMQSTGRSACAVAVTPQQFNRAGTVHGGFLMTLMDTLMGYAARSVLPENDNRIATSTLTTNFLEAVIGGEIVGAGRVISHNNEYVLTEARLSDKSGRLIATASGQFSRLRG